MTLEQDAATATPHRSATAPRPTGLAVDARRSRDDDGAVHPATRPRPRLSWEASEPASAFQVDVVTGDGASLWSSGVVETREAFVDVGTDLASFGDYRWSVRLRGADGAWSQPASDRVETGPWSLDDWTATWVSAPARSALRRGFEVDGSVARARLFITGQGLLRAGINGRVQAEGHLDPTRTDAGRALYRVYDVTDALRPGANTLEITLALGEWSRTGHDPRVLAELVIWSSDGARVHVPLDRRSTLSTSRIVEDEPFYLERHDAALEGAGPGEALEDSAFPAPSSDAGVHAPPVRVEADPSPAIRIVSRVPLAEIGRTGGARLYDAGSNIAGRSRIRIDTALPAGSLVRVVHGEHIGADGRIDTTNLTMPFDNGRIRQVVEWVATGRAGDVVEPWFAYHGFRYVEVQGLRDDATVEASAGILHTDIARIGRIVTDDPRITALLERAERTLLNNQHGVPEDCPTREQSAWTGDTAAVAEYAFAAFDMQTYLGKWIHDLLTSQAEDGGLPAIAPDVRATRMPADPVWGAALHRLLLGHWLHYGDDRIVREALPSLRRWALFQLSCADEGDVISKSPISYGHDWLALEQTPPEVHHTGATIDCLLTLARLEEEVGDPASVATWIAHAERLRRGARARFFDAGRGVFANGSQGAYAIAIDAGILTGADAELAAERIERDVRGRGNRVSGGFATTRTIVRALASTGRSQIIADMLAQPAEPGIGAMLVSGPGTFWECWWIDPANTGTGSLDHVGLGGVFAGWAWTHLAGIGITGAGVRSVTIAPQFVDGLDRLSASRRTPFGELEVSYEIREEIAHVQLGIPAGITATVVLPDGETIVVSGERRTLRVPVRRGRSQEPRPLPTWSAPSIAPGAGDVTGPRDLLEVAIESAAIDGLGASGIRTLTGLNCMPIPHAQPAGAVIEVTAAEADVAPGVRIEMPVDASAYSFLYALVDLCDDRWDSTARPVLRVLAADGTERIGVGTSWPAGWNRVAVDLGDWPGRSAITAIEISLRADDVEDLIMPQGALESPAGFHLGEIGLSRAPRTW